MSSRIILLFLILFFIGCENQDISGISSTSSTPGGPSSTSDSNCASTNTRIIDSGLKYQTLSTGRGLFSDIQIIPGTSYEAIAYDDASTTGGKATIMAAYYNGTNFVKETIAGVTTSGSVSGAVTGVRLGFLNVSANSGRPIVAWTTTRTAATATGSLYVAMRSTAFGSSGTWTSQLIDSNTAANRNAFRAMEMSVSPLDHVGITYMDGAATASRLRFSYCNASCNAVTDFTTMTAATDTVEAAATIASTVSTGVAWCKTSSATYFPAVTYPVTAGTRYASCSGAIATCKTAAGCTKLTANIVSTAAPIMQKLLIDN